MNFPVSFVHVHSAELYTRQWHKQGFCQTSICGAHLKVWKKKLQTSRYLQVYTVMNNDCWSVLGWTLRDVQRGKSCWEGEKKRWEESGKGKEETKGVICSSPAISWHSRAWKASASNNVTVALFFFSYAWSLLVYKMLIQNFTIRFCEPCDRLQYTRNKITTMHNQFAPFMVVVHQMSEILTLMCACVCVHAHVGVSISDLCTTNRWTAVHFRVCIHCSETKAW